jgi:hypothetical protein
LTDFLDPTMPPLFDQAIEDLIAQGLIHSEDGENYQITRDGINELKNRKSGGNTTLEGRIQNKIQNIQLLLPKSSCINDYSLFII